MNPQKLIERVILPVALMCQISKAQDILVAAARLAVCEAGCCRGIRETGRAVHRMAGVKRPRNTRAAVRANVRQRGEDRSPVGGALTNPGAEVPGLVFWPCAGDSRYSDATVPDDDWRHLRRSGARDSV
jgi:hypothetical protein